MVDHTMTQLAWRARALTLSVATTGAISMSATATGYARATGSFYTDNLWPGMEITAASGFTLAANNIPLTPPVPRVITAVTPLTISCAGCSAEGAAGGRTLTVGLPSNRAWENTAFTKPTAAPWVEEQYIPGAPAAQVTLGPFGELEVLPLYELLVHVPSGSGLTAARYTDALIRHMPPRYAITLSNGDVLRIRSDSTGGPFIGQLKQSEPGYSVKPVTFAGRLRTANSI